MQVLPGKGKNNHVLNKCLHEILDCTVHSDTTALLYKVLLSLLFPSVKETILRGRNMENNLQ